VVRAGPEGQEVAKRPGEVVARVGVDGLEETEGDPDVEEWAGDGSLGEDEDLERVGVLGGLSAASAENLGTNPNII
jgi:hypothetical protein